MIQNNNSRNKLRFICICVFLLSLSLGIQAQETREPEYVGWVSEITGEWVVTAPGEASKKIGLGQRLPTGGTVRPKISGPGYSIKIGYLNPKVKPEIRSCAKAGDCDQPIQLPRSLEIESSLAGRLLQAAEKFLTSSKAYISPISRGAGGAGNLRDAVVKMTDGEIDLTPVFVEMKPGLYLLLFQPVRRDLGSKAERPISLIPFTWEPNSSSSVSVDDNKRGLYKLSLLNPRTKEPTDHEAWILVSEHREYDAIAKSFRQAVELTEQWDKRLISSDRLRGLRRAYLESLTAPRPETSTTQ